LKKRKNSRNKGKTGELEVANLLKEHGYNTRRGQQYSGLAGDADVVGLPNIHIEVKRTERLSLYEAMEQAKRDAKEGYLPTVFHRRNRKNWVVIMEFDDWLKLYRGEVND
jgi:Holliday junction resolvase